MHRAATALVAADTPFEAVSYAWGDIDDTFDVQVMQLPFTVDSISSYAIIKVGANLNSMLQHLRDASCSRALWIDAISINQADLVERGQQVKVMRDIFKRADRVTMWLGHGTPDSDFALTTLEYIGRQIEYTQTGSYLPSPNSEEMDWWDARVKIELPAETWTSIVALVQRPSFERLWIMQEIQLANEYSTVRCGDKEILWYHFRRALLKCKYDTPGLPAFASPASQARIEHLYHLSNDLHSLDFDRLFYLASRCECADPRDRVFASLGLVLEAFAALTEPHYSSSVMDIQIKAFPAFTEVTKRLTLLGAMHTSTPSYDRPSWAPDLTLLEFERITSYYNFASGSSSAQISFEGTNELHVHGILLDEVIKVSKPLTDNIAAHYNSARQLISDDKIDACIWVLALGDLRDR
ncbi:hypothetical protein NX059_005996 [Plenodomus lindquistii]|nr:hypothetical protein NX059_005996 [Plenodomus lindquistii]